MMPTFLVTFRGHISFVITDEETITDAIRSATVKCWTLTGKTVEVIKAELLEGDA